jgi:hypothetical protein
LGAVVVVQLPNPPTTLKGLTMINKSNQFYRNAVCAMAQALDVKDDYATYKNLHSRSVALMDVYAKQTGFMRSTVVASIVGDVMAMRIVA